MPGMTHLMLVRLRRWCRPRRHLRHNRPPVGDVVWWWVRTHSCCRRFRQGESLGAPPQTSIQVLIRMMRPMWRRRFIPHVFTRPSTSEMEFMLYAVHRHVLKPARLQLEGGDVVAYSGGYSQRLPSASALGKIFTALPMGNPIYQMLELKLATYIDFPRHMIPGVLVTCADDIELYSTGTNEIKFDKPGFTALAHPSSLTIGTTHGVFVLEPSASLDYQDLEYRSCRRFLHKPSVQLMHQAGAVTTRRDSEWSSLKGHGGEMTRVNSEIVYTDSLFYVDHSTAKKLLAFYKELGTLPCEIDAYGDFLQALGTEATGHYTKNTANVTTEDPQLVNVREKIFMLLKGTQLNVTVLNNSKFYHIGTTKEYLFHFTCDEKLKAELNLQSKTFSIISRKAASVCVIHSILDPGSSVAPGTVIEYCRLGPEVSVGENCIISSSCIVTKTNIPSSSFVYSLCLNIDGQQMYATISCGLEDDLKRNVKSLSEIDSLQYCGMRFLQCMDLWGLKVSELMFSGKSTRFGLWNARIFPLSFSLSESVMMSVGMLNTVHSRSPFKISDQRLLSIEEMLSSKDVEGMLLLRCKLFEDISVQL
ncbi:fucose-1-phosphate guanylyltransferase isoform X2 [Ambystoma mexicanum]|uniref:fucose-1-phosphate guanylyltransferase isoform X2 n=1 Tax=Ambystoma mexicanum TaxID=8296 RepID=UPI0037E91FA7